MAGRGMLDVLVLISLSLLMGQAGAQIPLLTTSLNASLDGSGTARFSQALTCNNGGNVHVLAIRYDYPRAACNCTSSQLVPPCSLFITPAELYNSALSCWTTSACTVSFTVGPRTSCQGDFKPVRALIGYFCAGDKVDLAIDSESSATGTLLRAGYSAAGNAASGRNASWVCSVEASDCSPVNVTLLLVIRNGNNQTPSYFAAPAPLRRVVVPGVVARQLTYSTRFNVALYVVSGSALQNAYFVVSAARNTTVTCGRLPAVPQASLGNFSIVFSSPLTKFGLALSAYHESSGPETAGNWTCVVEAADCSTAPVNVSVYVRSRPCGPAAYFSVEGSRLESGGSVTRGTPLAVSLHLVQYSQVNESFVHVGANTNISMRCERRPAIPPSAVLTIVSEPPLTKFGQRLTGVHSSSGPETENSTWTCVVEAADCSTAPVNVSVFIRSGPCGPAAYFSVEGSRLESGGSVTRGTPLAVSLHLVQRSLVVVAFVHVAAQNNVTMTCGRLTSTPPTPVCNVPIVSPSPVRKFGQALTAVHSSSGPETAGDWTCVVEAADCSITPVNVTFNIRNQSESPASYFSWEEQRQNNSVTEDVRTPFAIALRLLQGSRVDSASAYFRARQNISVACGRSASSPPQVAISHCGTSPAEQPQSQTSVVGPAVGGAVAALVVIAVVVVVVVVVWRNRTQKAPRASERSVQQRRLNDVYEETGRPEDNHGAGAHVNPLNDIPDQHYANEGTAGAVTSENDTPYDVLGQKRPTADAKRDVIYSHLTENGNLAENVEYSYDRAGKGRRRDVITNAIYSTAPVSPHDEARPEDVEYSNERAGTSKSPGVITDPGGPDVHPQSPAAEAKQDDGSDLKMKVKAAAQRNGEAAGDLAEGPIYFNAEAL